MKENLIAVTPNITGNIGSCKTEVVTVTAGRYSAWKVLQKDIATNSCTGAVQTYDHYAYTPTTFGTAIGLVAIFLLVLVVVYERF